MSMLWNRETENICIVFRSWQITNRTSLLLSLLIIVLLGVAYEGLKAAIRNHDARLAIKYHIHPTDAAGAMSAGGHRRRASLLPSSHSRTPSGPTGLGTSANPSSRRATSSHLDDNSTALRKQRRRFVPPLLISRAAQVHRSLLYGLSVALSMFLMLIFMTYNADLIGAVLAGAVIGHYLFSRDLGHIVDGVDKGPACH
ncbi:Copper transporter [Ceraceosorus bombacis]|uniref:Copper transport protein n=1 Tax=Ceraceosorus bombacis TaxID=401625 RepID=A0A0P1BQZ7_9BASI|nr:Copper transporter [Ceraceosorus bombacis]